MKGVWSILVAGIMLVNQFCIVLGIVVSYASNYCVARWLPVSAAWCIG